MEQVTKFIESLPKAKKDQAISIAAATALLYTTYKLLRPRKIQENLREIPIPESCYPYVGHLVTLGDLPGPKISEWHKKHGPILNLKMGVQNWIMIDDPALLHKVFVSQGSEASYRPYSTFSVEYYGFHGKGLAFSNPGEGWQKFRTATLSILAPKQIKQYSEYLINEAHDLTTRLIEATERAGAGIDPVKYLQLCSLNFIFMVSFGRKFSSVEDPEFIHTTDVIEEAMKLAGFDNDLPNFLPAYSVIDYFAGTEKKMKDFIDNHRNPTYGRFIKEAREKAGPNFIKSLDESGADLSHEDLLVLMSDVIGGGTDTTAVSLSWAIAILSYHPDAQKKLIEEIDEFIKNNGRVPTFDDRDSVPYCVSTMKELLRMQPITPFGLPHTVRKDMIVDGYLLPKGSTICCSMESIHQNPTLYPNPEKFVPERFMNNLKTMQSAANGKLEDRDHFNFGWGRRICPGIYVAETEIFNGFISLFARCTIEQDEEAGLPNITSAYNGGLTRNPLPYKVKFIRRPNALI